MVASVSSSLHRFQVSLEEFSDQVLAGIVPNEGGRLSLEHLLLDDLVLAYACSRGNKSALSAFELRCGAEFDAVAKKLRLDEARRTDMRQILWQRLFVGIDGRPKILEYRGKGPLRNWFRVSASRILLNELRRGKRERKVLESAHGELLTATEIDPEFLLLEQIHCQQFRSSFQAAVQELQPAQRNSLRCHYMLGMTIEQMAGVLGIHRATAARRIAQAREELLRLTRERLRQDFGANTDELDSIIRRAQGKASLSVERLLNQTARAENVGHLGESDAPKLDQV